MEEIISKQTITWKRFPVKPVEMESVSEMEEDLENSKRSSKQEKQSKRTWDSKINKERKKQNQPVTVENGNHSIQESKTNQNHENAKPNKPASSKKNVNVERTVSNKVSIDEKSYSTSSNENFNNFFEQIFPAEENVVTEANGEQPPFTEENVMAPLEEEKYFSPQLVEVTAEADIDEYPPIQQNELKHIPSSDENKNTAIEEEPTAENQVTVTEEAVLEENFTAHDFESRAANEEKPLFFEENVKATDEEKQSLSQLTEVTAEVDSEYNFIRENQPMYTNEEDTPPSEKNVITATEVEALEENTTNRDSEPMEADEKQPPSSEENRITALKEDPTSFDQSKVNGTNETESNYMITATDFINVQIPVILGKYNIEICLEDEEIYAEKVKDILDISKKVVLTTCKFIPSELSPVLDNGSCKALKGNLMIEGFIQQEIKYIFENQQTSNYVQNQSAFNQMNQKNSMYLRKVNFGRYSYVPQTYSTNSPNPAQKSHVQYAERLINSMSKTIPFSSIAEINHFLHPPIFGSIEEKSFSFQNNPNNQMSNADTTQYITTTYYPENTHGKLIYSKIHENINFLKHEEKYIKTPRIKLKQFIVLELWIHLLQEQSVQVQLPKK